jgi:ABC-2 type transport system permease protein
MRHVRLVASRELEESFRAKSYWVTMAFLVAAVIAAIVLPNVLDGTDSYEVAVVGEVPEGLREDVGALANQLDIEIELSEREDRAAAEQAVRDDELDAALVHGDAPTLLRVDGTSEDLVAALGQASVLASTRQQLGDAGLSAQEAQAVLSTPPPEEVVLDDERAGRGAVTYFVSLVLYLALLMGGMGVATGVAVEKSSRIAEVLVTTVRPAHLLAGKVLGVGLSTLLLILAAAVPYSVAVLAGVVDLPAAVAGEVLGAVGWFALGYGIYATAFAALGALVDRQEDLGGAIGPLTTALVVAFVASIQAQSAPNSTLAVVTSHIPLSSPMVMPARMAAGSVGVAEVLLSVAIAVVTLVVLVRLGGTIYRRALLRGGRRLKLSEVLRG